jgi:hypothetical protein
VCVLVWWLLLVVLRFSLVSFLLVCVLLILGRAVVCTLTVLSESLPWKILQHIMGRHVLCSDCLKGLLPPVCCVVLCSFPYYNWHFDTEFHNPYNNHRRWLQSLQLQITEMFTSFFTERRRRTLESEWGIENTWSTKLCSPVRSQLLALLTQLYLLPFSPYSSPVNCLKKTLSLVANQLLTARLSPVSQSQSQSQSQSYITTDGQSGNLPWSQAPISNTWPIFPFFL